MIKPQTLKGFRDFLPNDVIKRQAVIKMMRIVFERFGFDPLETPALEYAETLLGKYGDEANKLLYLFKDRGGRQVGLRYDQTVPLARVVSQYPQLPKPFKRYQIQPVWRAENTQKGRYREFMQCDIDIIGEYGLLTDAEIIACVLETMKTLGFQKIKMLINDRSVFKNLKIEYVRAIDKLKKIGKEDVIAEMVKYGADKEQAAKFINSFDAKNTTPVINTLFTYLKKYGLVENVNFEFDPTLARGLDYYTSTIFELVSDDYTAGSLGGGGRYDKLIGQFIGADMPAVGFAFGFDRIIEAMEQLKLTSVQNSFTKVLVTVFSKDLREKSIELVTSLRGVKINSEIWLNIPETEEDYKLDKQLKYADKKSIPYVVIIGPEEAKAGKVKLKDMRGRTEEIVSETELISKLKLKNQNGK